MQTWHISIYLTGQTVPGLFSNNVGISPKLCKQMKSEILLNFAWISSSVTLYFYSNIKMTTSNSFLNEGIKTLTSWKKDSKYFFFQIISPTFATKKDKFSCPIIEQ